MFRTDYVLTCSHYCSVTVHTSVCLISVRCCVALGFLVALPACDFRRSLLPFFHPFRHTSYCRLVRRIRISGMHITLLTCAVLCVELACFLPPCCSSCLRIRHAGNVLTSGALCIEIACYLSLVWFAVCAYPACI